MFRLFWCAVHLLCSVCLCLCLCLYLVAPRVIAEVCLGVGLVGDSAGRVPASCDGLLTRSGSHWADAGGQAASRDVNLGGGLVSASRCRGKSSRLQQARAPVAAGGVPQ